MGMGLVDAKRIQRLLANVTSNPKNCSFEDLEHLLVACGFSVRKRGGSHVIFKRGTITLSIPKRKPVKEVYVEQVLAAIDFFID